MADSLQKVLQEESGNRATIRVLETIVDSANDFIQKSTVSASTKMGAAFISEFLPVILAALNGKYDPDKIVLDELFVKSPTDQLKDMGITQKDINKLLGRT